MNTMNKSANTSSNLVSFTLKSANGMQGVKLDNVFVASSIPARYPSEVINVRKYPHLADLPLQCIAEGCNADILIGMDNSHVLMPYEVHYNPEDLKQSYAICSLFGWALNRPAYKWTP